VTQAVGGRKAYPSGVSAGMSAMFVNGQPYTEDALDAAIASNIRYEAVYAWHWDKMDSHVLWPNSTKRAMEFISRHPNGCHVRWEAQSRSAGTSSSQASPAFSEEDSIWSSEGSMVEGPQGDLEQAITMERKHVVPVQHMWLYEDDDDESSSLFSSSVSGDEYEEKKVANKKKASEENTGAQTVAQGSGSTNRSTNCNTNSSPGAKADARIWETNPQAVARLLGPKPGSVCQQGRAEKPREPKEPQLHQRTKQENNVRECVIIEIVKAIVNSAGPDNSSSDEEQVQLQNLRGEADVNLSHFNALSREELMSVVPRCGEGQPTSIGSMRHATGACKVCAFFAMPKSCKNGIYCLFCHLDHKVKPRKGRGMKLRWRDRLRKQLDRLCQQVESDLSLDLDTVEMPPSLLKWVDVVKTQLRSYQRSCERSS